MVKGKWHQKFDDAMNGIERCGCGAESSGQPVKNQAGGWVHMCIDCKKGTQVKDRVNILAREEKIKEMAENELLAREARAKARQKMEQEAGQITLW